MTDSKAPRGDKSEALSEFEIRRLLTVMLSHCEEEDTPKDSEIEELIKDLMTDVEISSAPKVLAYCRGKGINPDIDDIFIISDWDDSTSAGDTISSPQVLKKGESAQFKKGDPLGKKYKIIERIGSGGMGDVYLARRTDIGQLVAIKVIKGFPSKNALERFRREALTVWQVTHPNFIRGFDVSLEEEPFFIVMEYVAGQTLDKVILEGAPVGRDTSRLDLIGRVRTVRDITRALAEAHELSIIHRDIKPENIIIEDESGRAVLTDPGLARYVDDEEIAAQASDSVLDKRSSAITQVGEILGTPLFMAPEQLQNPEQVDLRTDVYACGLLLYFCITGEYPYDMAKMSMMQICQAIMELKDLPKGLIKKFEKSIHHKEDRWRLVAIVKRCLQHRKEARYPDAGSLAGDLDLYLDFVKNRQREIRRRQKARTGWLITALAATILISGSLIGFYVIQRNAEALAAKEAIARAEAEARERKEADARLKAETQAKKQSYARFQAETMAREEAERRIAEQENDKIFKEGIVEAMSEIASNDWLGAERKLSSLKELEPNSRQLHLLLGRAQLNLRDPSSSDTFIWLAENSPEEEREEHVLMAMLSLLHYGRQSPAKKLVQVIEISKRLKSNSYKEIAEILIQDTQEQVLTEQAKFVEASRVQSGLRKTLLHKVGASVPSALMNYILGIYIERFFPDRALDMLNKACGINPDFLQAIIARQRIRRAIAESLRLNDPAKSAHLIAAEQDVILLRRKLPNDLMILMAYIDCKVEASRLPMLADKKQLYLREVMPHVEESLRVIALKRSPWQFFYHINGLLIETTIAKAYAIRYRQAREVNERDAPGYKQKASEAISRARTLLGRSSREQSRIFGPKLRRIESWLR